MHDEPPGNIESDDASAGEPTGVLEDFRQRSPTGFVDRVRNRIHRRVLAAEVADLTWRGPALIFMQWLLIVIDVLRGGSRTGGVHPDE